MTVSKQVFDDLEARIIDVVCNAYGSALSAAAQALAIPAGRFRLLPGLGVLRDEGISTEAFDRGVEIEWLGAADWPEPGNSQDATAIRRARFRLHVGYLFGKETPTSMIHLASGTSETAAVALKYARRRALSDAETIATALGFPEIATGGSLNPAIVECYRDGETVIDQLSGGRIVSVTPFMMLFSRDITQRYEPST